MAWKDLDKWPDGVLIIVHFVLCFVALSLMVLALKIPISSNFKSAKDSEALYKQYSSGEISPHFDPLRHHFSFSGWMALLIILLIAEIAIIIWFMFDDPKRYKLVLLIYYIVASVLGVLGIIFCFLYLSHTNRFMFNCRIDIGVEECDISSTPFFWIIIVAIIFTIAAFITHVIAAVLNFRKLTF